jgi:Protein of unknown function (DUF3370)
MFGIPVLIAQVQPTNQSISQTPPQEIFRSQTMRPLTGGLDKVPVFNSNNPEIVKTEGILLSTFPPQGKSSPVAHLNFGFSGRFDLFSHHIARAIENPNDLRTLYLGVIVHNPSDRAVTIDILQAASYLSQPDAPFLAAPVISSNPQGAIFRGPGDRVTNEVLRGKRQTDFPAQIVIPAKNSRMLFSHPIPVAQLNPPLNGRSTLLRLHSNGKVYLANLAMFAKPTVDGVERSPNLKEWQALLETGDLAGPREGAPSPPDRLIGKEIYGRVAAVAEGSAWKANLTDQNSTDLTIPLAGEAFSYGLSTLLLGKQGTGQNQSAKLLVRYSGTAYQAHGNYGIEYNLTLPLKNASSESQTVVIRLETPIKEDNLVKPGLRFRQPPFAPVFFRGTVRIRYNDDLQLPQTHYWHLVQQRGQIGEPLAILTIPPGDRRFVQVDLIYPPDSTPPQVLTVESLTKSKAQK